MDLGYLPQIARSEVIVWDELPDTAQRVLALRAVGLSAAKIARLLKMTKPNVEDYCKRYDPEGLCRVTPEQKRVITTHMLMALGVEALTEITEEKLVATDAKDLAMIAARAINTAERIRALDKGVRETGKTSLDSAMDYLDAEYEELDN